MTVTMFRNAYEALPDLKQAPTDGPFLPGDLCKVNGKAMVWDPRRGGKESPGGWRDLKEAMEDVYCIELPGSRP